MAYVDSPATNGKPPGELDWRELDAEHAGQVNALVADLEVQLVEEGRERIRIEQMIVGFAEREKRLRKAIAALKGEALGPGRPPGRPPTTGKPAKQAYAWVVSDKKVDLVHEALKALGGERQVPEISQVSGASKETTRRALTILRERELVRITRSDPRRGKFYALMPSREA